MIQAALPLAGSNRLHSTVLSQWEWLLQVNTSVDNIGARRLHTVLERIVEDISFDAPEKVRLIAQQPLLAQLVAWCSTTCDAPFDLPSVPLFAGNTLLCDLPIAAHITHSRFQA